MSQLQVGEMPLSGECMHRKNRDAALRHATAFCRAAGLSVALLFSGASHSEQAPDTTIQWYVMDYPPAYIVTGPQAGTGYQDRILDYFAAQLPELRIERRPVALARLLSNVAHGPAACAGALGKTEERERSMVFSRPIIYSLPMRLVVNATDAARVEKLLDAKGQVPPEVIDPAGFKTAGLVQGRTYGSLLDSFLVGEREKGNISNAARAELVFRMLARGRVDYSFGYPDEAGYYARAELTAGDAAAFKTFPIAGLPVAMPSYYACTDDAAGRRMIEAINGVIDRFGAVPPWTAFYLDWIDGNARRDIEAVMQAAATR
ncbi:MAG: transporter substrate-binding domain-containing protein [Alphaproteobacteria bacterium]|nr:MAG: transporter substrate-binding domain-containing protein [Alphaproteobacteria bacterium]